VDLGADGDEVPQELVDGLARAKVGKLEQLGVGLDDALDQPADLLGPLVGELLMEDVGLLDDGDGIVGGARTGVHLGRRASHQP
jgi:hypothetical protein